MAPAEIRLETLGGLRAFREGAELHWLERQRLRAALLVYLAVERTASRASLVAIFWPDSDENHARQALRQNLHDLGRVLGPAWVESRPRELRISDHIFTDLGAMEEALGRGDVATAISQYRGPFLHAVHLVDVAEWERWVDGRRLAAARAFRTACRGRVAQFRGQENWPAALAAAHAWVQPDAFDDEAQHALIDLLATAGRRTDAIRQYESYARVLGAEGLEPLDETRALHQRLLRSDIAAPARPAGMEPVPDAPTKVAMAPPAVNPSAEPRRFVARSPWTVRLRKRWTLGAAAALLILTAVLLRTAAIRNGPGAQPAVDAGGRVVVLPFSYQGSERFRYLSHAMMELLSRTLDTGTEFRTVDPRAVVDFAARAHGTIEEPALGRQLAERVGASHFVAGNVVESNGRLHVTARLYRSEEVGDPISSSVEGMSDSLFVMVDGLSAQLLVSLFGAAQNPFTGIAAHTTGSVEALTAFLEGEQLYRGLSLRTGRAAAYEAFHRAVEADPTFGFAWYRLSQLAYFSGGALSQVVNFADSAARYSTNLAWRDRTLIMANRAFARGAAREAEKTYTEVLATYPGSVEAWFGMTWLLHEYSWLLGRAQHAARDAAETVLESEPENFLAVAARSFAAAAERDLTRLDSLLQVWWGSDVPWTWRLLRAVAADDTSAQHALLRGVNDLPIPPLINGMQWIHGAGQNPAGARRLALLLAARPGTPVLIQALAQLRAAEYELALGKPAAAQQAFARLAALYPPWGAVDRVYHFLAPHLTVERGVLAAWRDSLRTWQADSIPAVIPPVQGFGMELQLARHDGIHSHLASYLIARIDVRLGEYDSALELAGEVERMPIPAGVGTLGRDLARSVRAHVYAARGEYRDALRALESHEREVPFTRRRFSWAYTQPHDRLLRARLLVMFGRTAEAEGWYRSLHYDPDVVLAGPMHLGLAELYESLGRTEDAVAEYGGLVELWRDAEPEFQLDVQRARARLEFHDSRRNQPAYRRSSASAEGR